MDYCTSCASPIPEGQGSSCSMCMGDIGHGSDGYYQQWAGEREQEEQSNREAEEEYHRGLEND